MGKKCLYLIDGSGLIFRAFFAIRHLTNSYGHPTNATYGFTTMLSKVIKDYAPTHIAVAFDTKAKTFRHEMYDQYKANRPEPPEELVPQFADVHRIVDAFNIAKLVMPGFEADDIIGTLADEAVAAGFDEVVIVTSDKDFTQIVGEKVKLLDTKKDEVTDIAKVKERFGTGPEGVIDFLALCGDSSDNVPGVPGVGPKTAKNLMEKYGSMEGVYENIDQVQGKLKEKLIENRDLANLSRKLVTIKRDVPIDLKVEDLGYIEPDKSALAALYSELEFDSLLSALKTPEATLSRENYKTVFTMEELGEMIAKMKKAGRFAFDTETTSTNPMEASLVGLSFCCDETESFYIPVSHNYLGVPKQPDKGEVLAALKPIMEDESLCKIGQNIKYDMIILYNEGIEVKGQCIDTMLASYLLNPERMSHSMDALSMEFLGHKCISFSEVCGKGKNAITFDEVDVETATKYSAEDANVTWLLAEKLAPLLEQSNLTSLFETLEMPLVRVLMEMETTGVKIDSDFFKSLHGEFGKIIQEKEKAIYEHAGHQFNLNSPKQVAVVLFDEIGLKPVKKTKTGPSTDVTVLAVLADQHEIPRMLLDYRSLHKLVSTYVDTLPALVNPKTGRIHCSFNQTVAATGRLSSSNPNLQNIPVRTTDGRKIREGFVPEPGNVLLSADYSQIELRVMAHLSGDPTMIEHFRIGEDIHRRTASEIFGIMPALVSKEERNSAKAINFGILYGISAFRLGKDLGIGAKKAQQYINLYFERYPLVRKCLDETVEKARETGYVQTILGRIRHLPQLQAKDNATRSYGERMALNTPIQGSAADLIKLAMIRLNKRIHNENLPLKMLIQVHDELVLETPKDQAEAMKQVVVDEMEQVYKLSVPLIVDASYGENWAVIH